MTLTKPLADYIIKNLKKGFIPRRGVQYFSVGLNSYFQTLISEYLDNSLKLGLSSFKTLIGETGSGKTHFIYHLREIAWSHDYIVSFIRSISKESVITDMVSFYSKLIQNLTINPEKKTTTNFRNMQFKEILQIFFENHKPKISNFHSKIQDLDTIRLLKLMGNIKNVLKKIESVAFAKAIQEYVKATLRNDKEAKQDLLDWFYGEDITGKDWQNFKKRYKIYEKLNKDNAIKFIRSLCQFLSETKFTGLCIFYYETSSKMKKQSRSKKRKTTLDNLRQIVDQCGYSMFPNTLFVYAIPPEIKNRLADYPALQDRIFSRLSFKINNPSSSVIYLNTLDLEEKELLIEIGKKIIKIYKIFNSDLIFPDSLLRKLSESSIKNKISINQRKIFITALLKLLEKNNQDGLAKEVNIKNYVLEANKELSLSTGEKETRLISPHLNTEKREEKETIIDKSTKTHKSKEEDVKSIIIFEDKKLLVKVSMTKIIPSISNYLKTLRFDKKREYLNSKEYQWRRNLSILNLNSKKKKKNFLKNLKEESEMISFDLSETNLILDLNSDLIYLNDSFNPKESYFEGYKIFTFNKDSIKRILENMYE